MCPSSTQKNSSSHKFSPSKYETVGLLFVLASMFIGDQGFIQRGGAEFFSHNFPYPEILSEYGYYISYLHVTERKYVLSKCLEICVRSNLRGI